MSTEQPDTFGDASNTYPDRVTVKRSRSALELVYSFAEGFILGYVVATAILFLVYFGIIWKVNRHE